MRSVAKQAPYAAEAKLTIPKPLLVLLGIDLLELGEVVTDKPVEGGCLRVPEAVNLRVNTDAGALLC
jgi:hypothetical protein